VRPSDTTRSPAGCAKRTESLFGCASTSSPVLDAVVPVVGLFSVCSNVARTVRALLKAREARSIVAAGVLRRAVVVARWAPAIEAQRAARAARAPWISRRWSRARRAVIQALRQVTRGAGPSARPLVVPDARRPFRRPTDRRGQPTAAAASRGLGDGATERPIASAITVTSRISRRTGRVERLRAVAERLVRRRVHLDDQPISARGDRGARHRRHVLAQPTPWLGSAIDRQVRQLVHERDRRQSKMLRVAGSKPRTPRSHRITFGFPSATTYSAARSSSWIVAAMPALEQHRPA
jgi:hypothetical protein